MGLKLNSFFCGAGGIDIGFIQAGFETVGAYDFDEASVETYKANIGGHVQKADIREVNGNDIEKSNVWTFGFPCQDLSKNGNMEGMVVKCTECKTEFERTEEQDKCPGCESPSYRAVTRSGLFHEVMRLLKESVDKPEIIMAENVPGLKKYLGVMKEEYAKAGYTMQKAMFNSKYWHVPQSRERYFVVGIRNDIEKEYHYPVQGDVIGTKLMDILDKEVDEKYFIDMQSNPVFLRKGEEFLIGNEIKIVGDIPQSLQDKRPDKDIIMDEFVIVKSATSLGYDIAFVGDSVNISHPKSATRRGRVGHGIAQTILTSSEQVVILPNGQARHYTPKEIARIQGFPNSFKQVVTDSQFRKQIGNAVSVPVVKAIAETMRDFLQKSELETLRDEMIESGMTKGFTHPDTLKISEQLDVIINKVHKAQG